MANAGETFGHYQLDSLIELRVQSLATDRFLATDLRTGEGVMIEILHADASSVDKARFATRARRFGAARHPALVSSLETTSTHFAFATPGPQMLVAHVGLAIARTRQKLAWLAQIAGALAALHKAGVVHGQLGLEEVIVTPEETVKLLVSLGADISASPLDDVRALGAAAHELILGSPPDGEEEAAVASRLGDAGTPPDAALAIARLCAGSSMTSADFAEKLAPFTEFSGPGTERLLPIPPGR